MENPDGPIKIIATPVKLLTIRITILNGLHIGTLLLIRHTKLRHRKRKA